MAKVGIVGLKYAIMETEDTVTSNPVYGEIKSPDLTMVSAEITRESNVATLYGNNQIVEQEVSEGNITLNLDLTDLPLSMQADVLGYEYDAENKTLIKKSTAQAPYVAIAFEFTMTGGRTLAVWLYKGKFQPAGASANTKAENTEYQTNQITANFAGLKGAGENAGRSEYNQEFAKGESTAAFYTAIPLATVTP